MFAKLLIKIIKEIVLDQVEKKFLDFVSKLFSETKLKYFTKINNQVNAVIARIQEVHDYIEPLLEEIKVEVESGNTKYLDDLMLFMNKEFTIKLKDKEYSLNITKEKVLELLNKADKYSDVGSWKRENAVEWIKVIMADMNIEIKESLIRASVEMAVQVLKDDK